MQTLENIKKNLINRISNLEEEETVRQIDEFVNLVEKRPTHAQLEMLKKLAKPMRKTFDIEELKREQNWKPIDREEFYKKLEDFDWQIPEDEFIELLNNI